MRQIDAKSLYRRMFVLWLYRHGKLFHFDDDPSEIISYATQSPLFSKEDAIRIAKIRDWLYHEELFEITSELFHKGVI